MISCTASLHTLVTRISEPKRSNFGIPIGILLHTTRQIFSIYYLCCCFNHSIATFACKLAPYLKISSFCCMRGL